MLIVSVMMGKITLKGSKTFKKEIIPSVKRDSVAEIALHDHLIIGLGDIWVMKNVDNKRKRKYYSSLKKVHKSTKPVYNLLGPGTLTTYGV